MNKLIIAFCTLGIALALSSNVKAQVTGPVEVSATVLQVITIVVNPDVSFGNVQTGAVAEISANASDGTEDSNASAPIPGVVTITGGAHNYTITQSAAAVLGRDGGAEELTFTPRYYHGSVNATSAILSTGYPVIGGLEVILDVGGQLQNPSVAGNYSTAPGVGGTHLQIQVSYDI